MAEDGSQYIDLDLSFNIHPIKKDVSKLVGDRAVSVALRNLIFTKFFERPFQPNKGCGVHNLLFEPMDPSTTIMIDRTIREVIANYEPRVILRSLKVLPNYDQQYYDISIVYSVINLQNPVELNIVLERLR